MFWGGTGELFLILSVREERIGSFISGTCVCDRNQCGRKYSHIGKTGGSFSDTLIADDINLISVPDLYQPKRLKAKVRYRQKEQWAVVTQINSHQIRVQFEEPQRAIAPGQAVVLYEGDIVVGGGTISVVE
ncbi:MAG: aminomethyltransferase beta-barrel domain-containing protein [Eubacterium sp.]